MAQCACGCGRNLGFGPGRVSKNSLSPILFRLPIIFRCVELAQVEPRHDPSSADALQALLVQGIDLALRLIEAIHYEQSDGDRVINTAERWGVDPRSIDPRWTMPTVGECVQWVRLARYCSVDRAWMKWYKEQARPAADLRSTDLHGNWSGRIIGQLGMPPPISVASNTAPSFRIRADIGSTKGPPESISTSRGITGQPAGATSVSHADGETPSLTFDGHRGKVNGVAEMLDGSLISWSQDGTVRLWEGETATQLIVFNTHHADVLGTLVFPDGRLLTWGNDDALRLWDKRTAEQLGEMRLGATRVVGSANLKDGLVVSWLSDGRIVTWDLNPRGKLLSYGQPANPARGALIGIDGEMITWHRDGACIFWDPFKGEETGHAPGPSGAAVAGVVLAGTGRYVGWTDEGTAWQIRRTGPNLKSAEYKVGQKIYSAVALGSGLAAFAIKGAAVAIVDLEWGKQVHTLLGHTGTVYGVSSTDANGVLSWSSDGSIRLWDARSGRLRRTLIGVKGLLNGSFETRPGTIIGWTHGGSFAGWPKIRIPSS